MRSISLPYAAFLIVAASFSTSRAQEAATKDLTAEEIVARHEATWAKLDTLAIRGTSKNLVHYTMRSRDEWGGDVHLEGIRKDAFEIRIDCRGWDKHLVAQQIHEAFKELPEEVEWRIDGVVTKIHSKEQAYITKEQFASPSESMHFGRTLSRIVTNPRKTLRTWVAEAVPSVTRITNENGDACWKLAGKLRVRFQLESNAPVDQTDDLTVIVNADRGFLIERMEFVAASGATMPSVTWVVSRWRRLNDHTSFPEKMRTEFTVAKANNLPKDDGERWSEFEVTEVSLHPAELEKSFNVRIPDGAVVHDLTDRPDAARVAIWGSDNKPKLIFRTIEAYEKFDRAQRGQRTLAFLREAAGQLFPDCAIEGQYDEANDSHRIVVRDRDGSAIREFSSVAELRVCALTQFYIGQLLSVANLK